MILSDELSVGRAYNAAACEILQMDGVQAGWQFV
jgi:hypothetical protein